MGFNPTYNNLDERQPMTAEIWNQTMADIQSAMSAIDGTELASPLTMAGDIDGNDNSIYGFKRMLGYGGADVCIRDVSGYGARGNNSTDDTVAIQNAVDDLPVTGGCIVFPPGTYIISAPIQMAGRDGTRNNVTFAGFGFTTVFKLAPTTDSCAMIKMGHPANGTTGMHVYGVKVLGNQVWQTAGTVHYAFSMADSTKASIANCWTEQMMGGAVDFEGSTDARIENVTSISYKVSGFGKAGSSKPFTRLMMLNCLTKDGLTGSTNGFLIGPGNYATLDQCSVYNSETNGFVLTTEPGLSLAYVSAIGCQAFDCGHSGFLVTNPNATAKMSHITVSGGLFANCARSGVYFIGAGDAPIRSFTITGTVCVKNYRAGIQLADNVKYGCISSCICSNNDLGAGGYAGIYAHGGASGDEVEMVSITANSCIDDGVSGATQDRGIYLTSNTKRCTVVANQVYGNTMAQITDGGDNNEIAHNPGF